MEVIRETQVAKQGRIYVQLPRRFWGRQVEIIVLTEPIEQDRETAKKSLRGCLRAYANPALVEREEGAWIEAVREKLGMITLVARGFVWIRRPRTTVK